MGLFNYFIFILFMLCEDNSEFNAIVIKIVAIQFEFETYARKTNERQKSAKI